jgi:hypothetical protein
MLSKVLPYWPIDPWLAVNPWANFQLDLLRTIPAILPPGIALGRQFSLGTGCACGAGAGSGAGVG